MLLSPMKLASIPAPNLRNPTQSFPPELQSFTLNNLHTLCNSPKIPSFIFNSLRTLLKINCDLSPAFSSRCALFAKNTGGSIGISHQKSVFRLTPTKSKRSTKFTSNLLRMKTFHNTPRGGTLPIHPDALGTSA